jgi:hypothetical protein
VKCLGVEVDGYDMTEAGLYAHLRNKLEGDVTTSLHLGLLAVRQARQYTWQNIRLILG